MSTSFSRSFTNGRLPIPFTNPIHQFHQFLFPLLLSLSEFQRWYFLDGGRETYFSPLIRAYPSPLQISVPRSLILREGEGSSPPTTPPPQNWRRWGGSRGYSRTYLLLAPALPFTGRRRAPLWGL